MKINFRLDYTDGTSQDVTAGPRVLLDFERKGHDISSGLGVEVSFQLAHVASRSDLDFEEWVDTLDDLEILSRDGEPVPAGPTSGGSPDSP